MLIIENSWTNRREKDEQYCRSMWLSSRSDGGRNGTTIALYTNGSLMKTICLLNRCFPLTLNNNYTSRFSIYMHEAAAKRLRRRMAQMMVSVVSLVPLCRMARERAALKMVNVAVVVTPPNAGQWQLQLNWVITPRCTGVCVCALRSCTTTTAQLPASCHFLFGLP